MPRKSKAPRRKNRKTNRRSAKKMSMNPQGDSAHVVCVQEAIDLKANNPYKVYFNINMFDRAETLAGQFQEYRCDKVELLFKPEFNTFQDQSGGATVPYLLTTMNRIGEQQPMAPALLNRRGATPQKFTKEVSRSYKPNTLQGVAAIHQIVPGTNPTGVPGGDINWSFTAVYDKWLSSEILSTTPNQASAGGNTMTQSGFAAPYYYGLDFYIQQDGDIVPEAPCGKLYLKTHWSFKAPRSLNNENNSTVLLATNVFQ